MGNNADSMPWSNDAIVLLRRLWNEGYSTAEIGRRLGVTKNAIVGKTHRLDLPGRPSPIKRGDHPGGCPKPTPKPAPKLAEIMVLTACATVRAPPRSPSAAIAKPSAAKQPAPVSAPERCRPLRVGTASCCWPLGEPGRPGFRFCEDPAVIGKPYCEDHVRDAYHRPRRRRGGSEPPAVNAD